MVYVSNPVFFQSYHYNEHHYKHYKGFCFIFSKWGITLYMEKFVCLLFPTANLHSLKFVCVLFLWKRLILCIIPSVGGC